MEGTDRKEPGDMNQPGDMKETIRANKLTGIAGQRHFFMRTTDLS